MSDFEISRELLNTYLEDARVHLEAVDHCLLTLEREGLDPDVISSVLGPLHTLKGNSGMIGLSEVKDYVHLLEDAFAQISEGTIPLEATVFDRLFAGASALREAVEQAGAGAGDIRSLATEKAVLESLLSADRAPVPPPRLLPSGPAAPATERDGKAKYVTARSNMVRVDFAQLDHLLNLVGELVIFRTKLHELGREIGEQLRGQDVGRELLDAVHQVAAVTTLLQETVMDIRMLPIRQVFERFPRMIRDLARDQGKEIELILEGEATRVDKAIIDEIGEPLVHLIRNSLDHGIEVPQVRIARGKTPTGTILLSAAQESNHIVITIMDDGAGIDTDRVRRKALERGLIRGDEALNDREAVQLIFSKGFSTADSVTDVSGRGVGLDVVLKSIERLNGLVEVETVPLVGTKFIIQLPLTLAIIAALLIEASGRTYALPLSAVVESIRFDPRQVHKINGRDAMRIRDSIVPLQRLSELFRLPEGPVVDHQYVVVLGRGEKRTAIVVDNLKGQQEVVIKALDAAGSGFAVAGATIMGDGRVVLILDVAALFEGGRHGLAQGRREAALLEG
jgi:two-component system chemotaxis sensor kinase CheA